MLLVLYGSTPSTTPWDKSGHLELGARIRLRCEVDVFSLLVVELGRDEFKRNHGRLVFAKSFRGCRDSKWAGCDVAIASGPQSGFCKSRLDFTHAKISRNMFTHDPTQTINFGGLSNPMNGDCILLFHFFDSPS